MAEQSSNGWSRYEVAVLDKLANIEDFMVESRSFMLEVRTTQALHADHPQRIAAVETRCSDQESNMGLLMWKIGVLAGIGGAVLTGLVRWLFSGTL